MCKFIPREQARGSDSGEKKNSLRWHEEETLIGAQLKKQLVLVWVTSDSASINNVSPTGVYCVVTKSELC